MKAISEEQLAIDEKVQALKEKWTCGDQKCKHKDGVCFMDPSTLEHIPLSHMALKVWASAMVGFIGVPLHVSQIDGCSGTQPRISDR